MILKKTVEIDLKAERKRIQKVGYYKYEKREMLKFIDLLEGGDLEEAFVLYCCWPAKPHRRHGGERVSIREFLCCELQELMDHMFMFGEEYEHELAPGKFKFPETLSRKSLLRLKKAKRITITR